MLSTELNAKIREGFKMDCKLYFNIELSVYNIVFLMHEMTNLFAQIVKYM